MIQIQQFYKNHLSNPAISAEELRQFCEDHLGKLKAFVGLPVGISDLIAPTQVAFDAFDLKLSARTTLLAAQEGGTITKNEALQLFRTTVRQREGRIRDKFPKTSGPYAEFFPQGLKEYNKARLGQVPGLLARLIAAADKYQADLGAPLLAEFTALKTTFDNARDGQLDAKGDLAQARADLAVTRNNLEFQLGVNILTCAIFHLGHPERVSDFFNQSLLEDPTRHHEDDPPPPPAP